MKRARVGEKPPSSSSSSGQEERTSGLAAPTLLLSGHTAAVTAARFSPSGRHVLTCSLDRTALVWETYGACRNVGVLSGSRAALLEAQWVGGGRALTVGADGAAALWDVEAAARVRGLRAHSKIAHCCAVASGGGGAMATGSDDRTAVLWDAGSRQPRGSVEAGAPVVAVALSACGRHLYTGGVAETVQAWDLRMAAPRRPLLELAGHADVVTGLALSADGARLLSNGADKTVRAWDVRPFCDAPTRQAALFHGAAHDSQRDSLRCAWSPGGGGRVAAGSSDGVAYVWDADTGAVEYALPGHRGAVWDVQFHPDPNEPVVVSCGRDKKVYLGELQEQTTQ